jgi:hypothetical protein
VVEAERVADWLEDQCRMAKQAPPKTAWPTPALGVEAAPEQTNTAETVDLELP